MIPAHDSREYIRLIAHGAWSGSHGYVPQPDRRARFSPVERYGNSLL
jgi:hypothetical protein